MYGIFVVIGVYFGIIILVFFYRNLALTKARNALVDNNNQAAVSLIWAWASPKEILAVHQRWGSERFGNLQLEKRPNIIKLLNPVVVVTVIFVIVYQSVFRFGGPLEPGDCPNTPNCSNYLIGCLTRFSFIRSLVKGYSRIQHCSGKHEISFDERF